MNKVTISKEVFDKMVSVILELPAKNVLGLVQEIQKDMVISGESPIVTEPKAE